LNPAARKIRLVFAGPRGRATSKSRGGVGREVVVVADAKMLAGGRDVANALRTVRYNYAVALCL